MTHFDYSTREEPYLTDDNLQALVKTEQFFVFPKTSLTVCCLTLHNGFYVIGTSACINDKNFNADVGRDLAREQAIDKLWELEGYRIKSISK